MDAATQHGEGLVPTPPPGNSFPGADPAPPNPKSSGTYAAGSVPGAQSRSPEPSAGGFLAGRGRTQARLRTGMTWHQTASPPLGRRDTPARALGLGCYDPTTLPRAPSSEPEACGSDSLKGFDRRFLPSALPPSLLPSFLPSFFLSFPSHPPPRPPPRQKRADTCAGAAGLSWTPKPGAAARPRGEGARPSASAAMGSGRGSVSGDLRGWTWEELSGVAMRESLQVPGTASLDVGGCRKHPESAAEPTLVTLGNRRAVPSASPRRTGTGPGRRDPDGAGGLRWF